MMLFHSTHKNVSLCHIEKKVIDVDQKKVIDESASASASN